MAASDWSYWDDERGEFGFYDGGGSWHTLSPRSCESDGFY